jgi:hypothetical protein
MKTLTLNDFLSCIDYRITEGSQYLWTCYGDNAFTIDSWNGKHGPEGRCASCIFDTETTEVYEVTAWDYKNNREYRWINPDFIQDHKNEAKARGVDFNQSSDDRKFIDLEVVEDILEKTRAIMHGEEYDTRVIIQLELSSEEELLLMRAAHAEDITVNEFVERILEAEIARYKDSIAT